MAMLVQRLPEGFPSAKSRQFVSDRRCCDFGVIQSLLGSNPPPLGEVGCNPFRGFDPRRELPGSRASLLDPVSPDGFDFAPRHGLPPIVNEPACSPPMLRRTADGSNLQRLALLPGRLAQEPAGVAAHRAGAGGAVDGVFGDRLGDDPARVGRPEPPQVPQRAASGAPRVMTTESQSSHRVVLPVSSGPRPTPLVARGLAGGGRKAGGQTPRIRCGSSA